MLVKKYHLSDVKIFRVIECVAIEAFDQYPLAIIPKGEGVVCGYYCQPFFFGMQSSEFDFIGWRIAAHI